MSRVVSAIIIGLAILFAMETWKHTTFAINGWEKTAEKDGVETWTKRIGA